MNGKKIKIKTKRNKKRRKEKRIKNVKVEKDKIRIKRKWWQWDEERWRIKVDNGNKGRQEGLNTRKEGEGIESRKGEDRVRRKLLLDETDIK